MVNIYYGKAELNMSDHKPIIAMFEVKIKKSN